MKFKMICLYVQISHSNNVSRLKDVSKYSSYTDYILRDFIL